MDNLARKSVYQIVGNSICVESNDGKKVYKVIFEFLKNKQKIALSFLNVNVLTSAFLNSAVGALYKDFSEEEIRNCLKVEDINQTYVALLKRVVDVAKSYYKNPERMEESVKEILEEN